MRKVNKSGKPWPNHKRANIWISNSIHERLEKIAEYRGTTKAALMRMYVTRGVTQDEEPYRASVVRDETQMDKACIQPFD